MEMVYGRTVKLDIQEALGDEDGNSLTTKYIYKMITKEAFVESASKIIEVYQSKMETISELPQGLHENFMGDYEALSDYLSDVINEE